MLPRGQPECKPNYAKHDKGNKKNSWVGGRTHLPKFKFSAHMELFPLGLGQFRGLTRFFVLFFGGGADGVEQSGVIQGGWGQNCVWAI